jgi:hypothetical protein
MSPRRPEIGVKTAPARSVAVTIHDALEGLVESNRGSSGTSGTMSVCMNEQITPHPASVAVIRAGLRVLPVAGGASTFADINPDHFSSTS